MPLVVNPLSPLVPKLSGVHFFGFDPAPCSQRVGFALAEKGLLRERAVSFMNDSPKNLHTAKDRYLFRNVSLIKHDNLTEAWSQIQPNMVVPALVHDGRLYVESMDIIDYLDEAWPTNPLRPVNHEAARLCDELVQQGKDLHVSIRHITFHWSLGAMGKINVATQAKLNELQADDSPEKLAEFYSQFSQNDIDKTEFVRHLHLLESGYAAQEVRLAKDGHEFLTGGSFSTADIIWAIKILRLNECGYPLGDKFPLLASWYERISERPAFRQGVVGRYRFFHHAFRFKAGIENLFGKGIRSSLNAAT
ncbi:MAG: glutathione S-transferase [Gammaproteobacteria bacterium]|jgi:glutathione S-transferase